MEIRIERTVRPDGAIIWKGRLYQTRRHPHSLVTIEETAEGVHLLEGDHRIKLAEWEPERRFALGPDCVRSCEEKTASDRSLPMAL